MPRKIDEETMRRVREHMDERPRAAAARAAGVPIATFYNYVHMLGGKVNTGCNKRDPERERIVRENYAHMSGREIEDRFGIPCRLADNIARRLGVRHTDETKSRLRTEQLAKMNAARNQASRDKKARKMRAVYKLERWRVWEGRPQKTRLKIAAMSRACYKAKWYLMNRRGYAADPHDCYALIRTGDTRRSGREDYYTSKYKLKFK